MSRPDGGVRDRASEEDARAAECAEDRKICVCVADTRPVVRALQEERLVRLIKLAFCLQVDRERPSASTTMSTASTGPEMSRRSCQTRALLQNNTSAARIPMSSPSAPCKGCSRKAPERARLTDGRSTLECSEVTLDDLRSLPSEPPIVVFRPQALPQLLEPAARVVGPAM